MKCSNITYVQIVDVEVVAAMDLKVIICPTRPEVPIPEPAGRLVIFKTMVDTGPKMALANIGGSQIKALRTILGT